MYIVIWAFSIFIVSKFGKFRGRMSKIDKGPLNTVKKLCLFYLRMKRSLKVAYFILLFISDVKSTQRYARESSE